MTLAELLDVVLKTEIVYLNKYNDEYGMSEIILDCEPFENLSSNSEYWSHNVLWITSMVSIVGQPILQIEIAA